MVPFNAVEQALDVQVDDPSPTGRPHNASNAWCAHRLVWHEIQESMEEAYVFPHSNLVPATLLEGLHETGRMICSRQRCTKPPASPDEAGIA